MQAGSQGNKTKAIMPMVYLDIDINLKTTGNTINGCQEWKID